ncbi:hypothetical protein SIO70_18905 [Chitinophaga sancti]|uniref:hypothetical protein n=1 Tax=Chitinophaga sancti TaxID=1004 RepID=UPI002A747865|nr:hypothetical protein [Chitinophaga sancti]WPQ60419.1 hypothetical protein SIO70_18905 [Chitinophaga sancti]
MNKMLLTILLTIHSVAEQGKPLKASWFTLLHIKYEERYLNDIKGYMLFPKFPQNVKNLDGKLVEITGFVIPVDKTGASLALSANPYASCYFCGGGSPASIITVKLKKRNTGYDIDDYKKFRGKLRLNATDINEFYYVLELSEEVN